MTPTEFATSTQIAGEGWFIFGGNSTGNVSQKLKNVYSNWEVGPEVPTPGIRGQCAVQVLKNSQHQG
jgi:hypothetical protein